MEFSDLNEDIRADELLIPDSEISNKRLLKRTSRHNIHKADWFGCDVLVYEPIEATCNKQQAATQTADNKREQIRESRVELEELESRLGSINLRLSLSDLTKASHFHHSASVSSECDSAYSSISSTPRYHTKNQLQSEFEFPTSACTTTTCYSPSLSWCSSFTFESSTEEQLVLSGDSSEEEDVKSNMTKNAQQCDRRSEHSAPVILNRESYRWLDRVKVQEVTGEEDEVEQPSSWYELNELRLIAHESFMLFMGAILEELPDRESLSTSLVMQMNHPKSVSLHNLLHATKLGSASPVDRFYSSSLHHHHRQPLGLKAKLSVCQQVTNAMTYLHDKNIVHGRLTSVNIYLEFNQRVKISLIDNEENAIATSNTSTGRVEFNLSSLTYLSPELIRTISVVEETSEAPLVKIDTNQLTKKSDVFSFGTFLYELFQEKYPLSETHHSASELIYLIGSNQMESKNLGYKRQVNTCPPLIEQVISACWRHEPHSRPHFKQLALA